MGGISARKLKNWGAWEGYLTNDDVNRLGEACLGKEINRPVSPPHPPIYTQAPSPSNELGYIFPINIFQMFGIIIAIF